MAWNLRRKGMQGDRIGTERGLKSEGNAGEGMEGYRTGRELILES